MTDEGDVGWCVCVCGGVGGVGGDGGSSPA